MIKDLAIEARHLVKTYRNKAAVRDLSLSVRPGVFYAFLGPNGAGKSTTLRMLTGLLKPTSGDVLILGQSIEAEPLAVKSSIGLVPDDLPLFDRLTGEETLLFTGRIHGLPITEARHRSAELLEYFDLAEVRAQMVLEYSLGMRKKLALAAALIHKPRVLFLDEALNGIDPVSVKTVADLLRSLVAQGLTIFFTTHVLDVAERLCDEIGVIHEGRLVASGTIDDIKRLRQMGADARLEDVFLQVVGAEEPKTSPSFLRPTRDMGIADSSLPPPVNRLRLLLGVALRIRLRAFLSAGASSILIVLSGIFYLGVTVAMGAGAFVVLSGSRGVRVERIADIASLSVTMFGVFFLTRPLILTNLSGGSLQNLLHLPIRRGELLAYSLLTGVVTPLVLESPVLVGAGLGAASRPGLILVTLPLALLSHLTLLTGAHAMSLAAVLLARRRWISDAARLLAFSVFLLPSILNSRGARDFLRPVIEPLARLSPLGWAARAVVHAGAGDLKSSLGFALPAFLLLAGLAVLSMSLLNRILRGDGEDRVRKQTATPRPARALLPGALGALIETQLRTQLRTPAARLALLMPTLMMGAFALSLSRPGTVVSPMAMVVFLSLVGGNAFVMIGRGVALILGTPVSRGSMLVASDVSGLLFRLPPLLAVLAVAAWRSGTPTALEMGGLVLALLPISMGVQHFVTLLRPFALPKDRLNPFAQRVDGRQSSHGFLSLLATVATALIASPFLFLVWLSSRIAGGAYGPWLLALSGLGAFATYAILIALAERFFLKRELQVLEVLLDDSPG